MKRLYIIAGPNGAGKTTASYTILPEMLDCDEFLNADEIARGLSPFKPQKAAIQAGRLMLAKIHDLLKSGQDFAFETTLATRSYKSLVERAKLEGYEVILIFLWLQSSELAVRRVKIRVEEGGPDIDEEIIIRRYTKGLENFFNIFDSIVDQWMFINNSGDTYEVMAERTSSGNKILNREHWAILKEQYSKEI